MTTANLDALVQNAIKDNPAGMGALFADAMVSRIQDVVAAKKIEVAQSMFATPGQEEAASTEDEESAAPAGEEENASGEEDETPSSTEDENANGQDAQANT